MWNDKENTIFKIYISRLTSKKAFCSEIYTTTSLLGTLFTDLVSTVAGLVPAGDHMDILGGQKIKDT